MTGSRFVSSTMATSGALGVSLLFSMAASIVAARVLGLEGKGQLALLLLVPTTLMALGDLGIRQSSVYLLASKKRSVNQVFSGTLVAGLVLGLALIGIAVLAFRVLGDSLLRGVEPGLFYTVISILPTWLILHYVAGVFRGLDRPLTYNILMVLEGGFYLGLMGLMFLSVGRTLEVAVMARVASVGIVAVIGIGVLWRQERGKLRFVLERSTLLDLLNKGIQVSIILSLGFLNRRVAMFLVNNDLGVADVGLYAVALSIAELVWLFPDAVGTILFPTIASLSKAEADKVTPMVSRLTIVVTTAMAIALAVTSGALVPLLYGAAFAPAVGPLLILLPGVVLLSVHKVLWTDIMGRGRPLLSIFSRAATLIILVTLVTLLVPIMGLAGAALATSLSFAVGTLVLVLVFARIARVPWFTLLVPERSDFKLLFRAAQRVLKLPNLERRESLVQGKEITPL